MGAKRRMWLGKQVGFGIVRHHRDAAGVLERLRRKREHAEILRPRPRRGSVQQYSCAGGSMSCLDGLKASRLSWTDPPHQRPLDIAACMASSELSLPLLEAPCLRGLIGHARRCERLSGGHSEFPVHCGCMM